MNSWPKIKLGDLCDIVAGSTPDSKNLQYWNGDIKWVTPAEMKGDSIFIEATERKITQAGFDSCSTKLFPKGAVILSTRAPIGKVAIAETEMCSNQGIKSLIPKPDKLDSFYLYWWLKDHADYLNSLGSGATFKELSMTVLKSIQIPLPPIDVQRKVAALLNACYDLKKIREEADKKMARFAMAVFHQMFGDPGKNERKWTTNKIQELCELGRGRVISQTYLAEHRGQYPVYSSQTKDGGKFGEIDSYDFEGEYLTWTTDGANAGTVFHRTGKFNCTNVCGTLRSKSDDISMEFLLYALGSISKKYVSQASGNPKLMNRVVANIEVIVPPLELQKQFVDRIISARILQKRQEESKRKLDTTFKGLISEYV